MIAPPSTADPISVARTPTAAATGAVSAKESGTSPIETSQSRLETRPSREEGTCRCLIVAQTIVPAGLEGVEEQAREHQLPRGGGEPVPGDSERRHRPAAVRERHVASGVRAGPSARRRTPPLSRPPRRRGRDRAPTPCRLFLTRYGRQHLGRAEEEQIRDRCREEGAPEPDSPAHEPETFLSAVE